MNQPMDVAAYRHFLGESDRLREHAGNPSYDELLKVSDSPKSTIHARLALSGLPRSLADWPFFEPLISMCINRARSHGFEDSGTELEWREFWKASADGQVEPSPLESAIARARAYKAKQRAQVLNSPGVLATLEAIYPAYPLVNLWGVRMPICEFPASREQWHNTEAAVGALLDRSVPAYDEYSEDFDPKLGKEAFRRYVERFESADEEDRRHFFPGAAYALHSMSFDIDNAVTVNCTMGRYFTSLATSEDLDEEMMQALAGSPREPVPLSKLPRRSWLHSMVGDPVVDGRHRAAAVSHATVIVTADGEGGFEILLPLRAHNVATHAHFNHVAPSGIFAPYDESSPSPLAEYSVMRNFYREWVEELYALEKYEYPPYSVVLPDPEDEHEITRLKDLLRPGGERAKLYYTGVSENLLTLRPEICMLLLVTDSNWLDEENEIARTMGRPFKLGWEYETSPWAGARVHNRPGQLRLRLDGSLQPADGSRLEPSFLIPNAAAAITLAIRVMKDVLS